MAHCNMEFPENDLSIGVEYDATTDRLEIDLMDDHNRLVVTLTADDWQRISAAVVRTLLASKGLK